MTDAGATARLDIEPEPIATPSATVAWVLKPTAVEFVAVADAATPAAI